MQYVCTRLLPFLRRAAATTPFPDTRQRRGAAPETALSSAVSSQPSATKSGANPARHRQPAPDASHA